ncbi:hypothetical protein IIY68_00745 [Candidatus Saccharibacteria bacterium]|nr:hypothetical protein [Candidatus Saccharibacteria bacterium]
MKEGEPVLGGPQVSPGNVQPTNPGVQPVGFETLQNTQTAQATPLVSTPSPTFAPSTPPVGTQLNNPAPLQPAPTSPQIPPQPLRQFSPQSTTSPAAPNMGDIILSDTPPQKSKKGLVIALVLFVIILASGLGVYFFISQNAKNTANTTTQTLASNYREAFNEYANYILYGQDSLEDIVSTYEPGTFYSIWQAADEKNKAFFDKSKILFDSIIVQLQKQENDIDFVVFNNYSDIFNFYYLYNTVPRVSSMNILEKYLQDGKESTLEYINNSYKVFDESSGLAQIYGRNQKEVDLLTLDQIDTAYSNGCIEGNTINEGCSNSLWAEFLEQKADFIQNVNSITYEASRDVVLDCFNISDKIYNLGKG